MDKNQQQQSDSPTRDPKSYTVLSIDCLKGTSKADEWTADMLQTGDIVEEFTIGGGSGLGSGSGSCRTYKAPFKNGRSGVQKILHGSFKNKETSILVRVRRGAEEFAELQACIVPESGGRRNCYMLRSITDPNYAAGFTDRTEADCLELLGESVLLICFSRVSVLVTAFCSFFDFSMTLLNFRFHYFFECVFFFFKYTCEYQSYGCLLFFRC